MKIILQKFIAESGYCSRRRAEELIKQKKVLVNSIMAEFGMRVGEDDDVRINGYKLSLSKEKIYIILNKPKGYTCTNKKFLGEKNVFDLIGSARRLFVVGRLDKDSRGLVLLTNDGDLTLKLTHPRYEHEKEYIVEISNFQFSISKPEKIREKFTKGVDVGDDDGVVRAKDVKYLGNNKFKIILTEGKKRQIRRMFKAVGCGIKDLARVRIGNLGLGNLEEGSWRKLSNKEVQKIKSFEN